MLPGAIHAIANRRLLARAATGEPDAPVAEILDDAVGTGAGVAAEPPTGIALRHDVGVRLDHEQPALVAEPLDHVRAAGRDRLHRDVGAVRPDRGRQLSDQRCRVVGRSLTARWARGPDQLPEQRDRGVAVGIDRVQDRRLQTQSSAGHVVVGGQVGRLHVSRTSA